MPTPQRSRRFSQTAPSGKAVATAFKESTGGTLQRALNEVFADDTHAVSLVRLTADRPDRPDKHMDEKEANVFHLDDKGRAYEFWASPTTRRRSTASGRTDRIYSD